MKCIVMLSQLYNLHGQCVNRVDYLINLVISSCFAHECIAHWSDHEFDLYWEWDQCFIKISGSENTNTGKGARSTLVVLALLHTLRIFIATDLNKTMERLDTRLPVWSYPHAHESIVFSSDHDFDRNFDWDQRKVHLCAEHKDI